LNALSTEEYKELTGNIENFDEALITSDAGTEIKPKGQLKKGTVALPKKDAMHQPEKEEFHLMGVKLNDGVTKPFKIKRVASLQEIRSSNMYLSFNYRTSQLSFVEIQQKLRFEEIKPKSLKKTNSDRIAPVEPIHESAPPKYARHNTTSL
jgi:hypothetical protein